MSESNYTVIGNLVSDPDLKFTSSGHAVVNLTIAQASRLYDKASGEWKDGEALFLRASLWRDAAENAAESLTKGMRVIATGKLKQRSFTTKEGEKRSSIELEADEIGPSLRYARAIVSKVGKGAGDGSPVKQGVSQSPWGGNEAELPPF